MSLTMDSRLKNSVLWEDQCDAEPRVRSVLTGERAEDLLLAGVRLLPPPLQDPLDRVEQAEHLGEVTEHRHLYQTGIWDQCGNQSKGHLVSQKGGTNSAAAHSKPVCIPLSLLSKISQSLLILDFHPPISNSN